MLRITAGLILCGAFGIGLELPSACAQVHQGVPAVKPARTIEKEAGERARAGADNKPAAASRPRADRPARKQPSRPGGVGPAYEIRTFKSGDDEIRYGWLTPASIEADKQYPLVVCLHGRGGNTHAADVLAGDAMREKYPAFVFAPECNQPAWWASVAVLGRGEHPERLSLAIAAVRELLKNEPIDPARVYITGQSMGGVGSWAAAAQYPELFAAAVPVCGAWPIGDAPKMIGVPIWAFHGALDGTVPVKFSRELTAAVAKAGGTAKYTEYEKVGHGSWERAYADEAMWRWMFEQRKNPAASKGP